MKRSKFLALLMAPFLLFRNKEKIGLSRLFYRKTSRLSYRKVWERGEDGVWHCDGWLIRK